MPVPKLVLEVAHEWNANETGTDQENEIQDMHAAPNENELRHRSGGGAWPRLKLLWLKST